MGCLLEIGETWYDLKEWRTRRKDKSIPSSSWRTPAAAIGLMLVIFGVFGEGVFEGFVSIRETELRAHDEQVLGDTIREAGAAKGSAQAASCAADRANLASGGAVEKSNKADKSANNALTLATGARTEADSLTQSVADAKQKAADAVAKLADAEQRLADSTQREAAAEAKLSAIKTPRSLVQTDELVAALKTFKGTEYTLNVFMDDEAVQFTKDVAGILDKAGWVRKQPAGMRLGVPTLDIIFDHGAESVPSCIDTGISLHAFTKEPLKVLQTLPFPSLPKTIQAALVLKNAIAPHISPPDERNVDVGVVDPKPQDGGPIIICIGKKP